MLSCLQWRNICVNITLVEWSNTKLTYLRSIYMLLTSWGDATLFKGGPLKWRSCSWAKTLKFNAIASRFVKGFSDQAEIRKGGGMIRRWLFTPLFFQRYGRINRGVKIRMNMYAVSVDKAVKSSCEIPFVFMFTILSTLPTPPSGDPCHLTFFSSDSVEIGIL